jgi:hypothetical protein
MMSCGQAPVSRLTAGGYSEMPAKRHHSQFSAFMKSEGGDYSAGPFFPIAENKLHLKPMLSP